MIPDRLRQKSEHWTERARSLRPKNMSAENVADAARENVFEFG